ncbi:hypothetical protein GUJ93_ZPchr0001g30769 [Zizania palustris]|uniref:Uncharacterized protein n=1 Tax=Zizania palustris TaxID=103762 RepID=A0A8J5RR62_ZIZPA|nr:hypothetical protein GUJ93_ZPchr0001g30769 [Zizania palustris]
MRDQAKEVHRSIGSLEIDTLIPRQQPLQLASTHERMSVPARSPARIDADRSAAAGSASGIRLKGGDGKRSGEGATAALLLGMEGAVVVVRNADSEVRRCEQCFHGVTAMEEEMPTRRRRRRPPRLVSEWAGQRRGGARGVRGRRRDERPGEPASSRRSSWPVGGVGYWQLVRPSDQAAPAVGWRSVGRVLRRGVPRHRRHL